MGFVIREIDSVFIGLDNFQVLPTKRGKELLKQGLATKTNGVIIIIYPEFDFEEFYKKHCKRIPNDNRDFTIIVKDEINIPEKEIIRKIIEEILKDKNNQLRDDKSIIAKISLTNYKVKNNFSNEKARCGLIRLRDINNKKIKDLDDLIKKKIISENEYQKIKEIYNFSFQNKRVIKEIWLIGHTDVI